MRNPGDTNDLFFGIIVGIIGAYYPFRSLCQEDALCSISLDDHRIDKLWLIP